MKAITILRAITLATALVLAACGGGGGGGSNPPPPPAPDTTAPNTTLSANPPALGNQSSVTFTATANESGTFEASVDAGAFTAVSMPFTVNNLADGAHTVAIRARDAAGNVDATPVSFTFTVDTAAPDTSLSGAPAALSPVNVANFTLSSADAAATFEASLDGAAFAAATSPLALANLAEGAHVLNVRARDAAGNVDATPASAAWVVDTVPPDTALAGVPAALTAANSASIALSSPDANASFEVSVDGAAFAAATSPVVLGGLAEGPHIIAVRARDVVGNVDTTPATATWTVDTSAPDTALAGAPAALTQSRAASITLTSADANATFEVSLDGAGFAAATSPVVLANLADGQHTVEARARDAAGNLDATPATATWTVDTTPPDTAIGNTPAAATRFRTASFSLWSADSGASFEASLDGAAFATVTAPFALSNLADGAHTVNVRARDAAGNVDATPATYTWTIDGTGPSVQVIFPGTRASTDAATLRLRGTAADANGISSLTVNGTNAVSSDGFLNWTATVNVAHGSNDYVVAVEDGFGNVNDTTSVNVAHRGLALAKLGLPLLDLTGNRVFVTDGDQQINAAIDLTTGVATTFARNDPVTSVYNFRPGLRHVDRANNRLIGYVGGVPFAVDLTTLQSTVLAPPAGGGLDSGGGTDYAPALNHLYVTNVFPAAVLRFDLTTGTSQVISQFNVIGSGPDMVQPTSVVLDTSPTGGGNRLLVGTVGSSPGQVFGTLLAVDLATGNRTVLSYGDSSNVGYGPAMFEIGTMKIDAANNRVLISENSLAGTSRLFAVDLTTGNRSVLLDTGSKAWFGFDFDASAAEAYLAFGSGLPAKLVRFALAPETLTTIYDTAVGAGPRLAVTRALELDSSGPTPVLYASGFWSPWNSAGGVVRIQPATGARAAITGNGVGAGPAISVPASVHIDSRAGAPANQLLVYETGANPTRLYGVNTQTGDRTVLQAPNLDYFSTPYLGFDPVTGDLLAGVLPSFGSPRTMTRVNVASGVMTAFSGPALGSGPDIRDFSAIANDTLPGGARRYVAAAWNPATLYAIDPNTGNRVMFSQANTLGSGPVLDSPTDLEIDVVGRRVLSIGINNSLQFIDLDTGNRTHVSGRNTDDGIVRGAGPNFTDDDGTAIRMRADFGRNVAFVMTHNDALMLVDLTNGDRALISR